MEEYETFTKTSEQKKRHNTKKILVVIILLLVIAGILYWKVHDSGYISPKKVIGVKLEDDGTYVFTDRPEKGMTIIELPPLDIFKGNQYIFGPGIITLPESTEDEFSKSPSSDE